MLGTIWFERGSLKAGGDGVESGDTKEKMEEFLTMHIKVSIPAYIKPTYGFKGSIAQM